MGIPTSAGNFRNVPKPPRRQAPERRIQPEEEAMPDLVDVLDDVDRNTSRRRQNAFRKASQPSRVPSVPQPSESPQKAVHDDDGWRTDPKTGKRYKPLRQSSPEAVKASRRNKNSGLTLEQAREMIELDEDFDVDDLDSAANTFMAHLRVPPSKEELAQARTEQKKKMARIRERNRLRQASQS